MKFYIYSDDELVGWTELKLTDKSMGVASGTFHPEIAYQKIRSVIQEFFYLPQDRLLADPHSDEKWNRYQAKVDTLNIKIVGEDGIALNPVGFNIADSPDEYTQGMQSEDAIMIDIFGLQRHEREKYFAES
jgi:hypothetical protein